MDKIVIPPEEIVCMSKLDVKNSAFVRSITGCEDIRFDDHKLSFIKDGCTVVTCRVDVMGCYGKDEEFYHWTWPWAQVNENKTLSQEYDSNLVEKIKSTERATLKQLMTGDSCFINDPMIISYIQACLVDELNLECMYVVDLGQMAYICFGVTDVYYTPVEELKKQWQITPDIETDD
jgi:hypothetical protein